MLYKYKFEELLSEETKNNIIQEVRDKIKSEMTEEEQNDFFNVHLDNSFYEMIKFLFDEN